MQSTTNEMISRLLPLVATLQLADGFFISSQASYYGGRKVRSPLLMADHSSVTSLEVGDEVTVVEDVLKAGKNIEY
jgi:hypothetical protein